MDVFFFSVLDVSVNFTSSPSLVFENDQFFIIGCTYESTNDRNLNSHAYWLVDDVRKEISDKSSSELKLPDYLFSKANQQGFYQCAIHDPGLMRNPVISSGTYISCKTSFRSAALSDWADICCSASFFRM